MMNSSSLAINTQAKMKAQGNDVTKGETEEGEMSSIIMLHKALPKNENQRPS